MDVTSTLDRFWKFFSDGLPLNWWIWMTGSINWLFSRLEMTCFESWPTKGSSYSESRGDSWTSSTKLVSCRLNKFTACVALIEKSRFAGLREPFGLRLLSRLRWFRTCLLQLKYFFSLTVLTSSSVFLKIPAIRDTETSVLCYHTRHNNHSV